MVRIADRQIAETPKVAASKTEAKAPAYARAASGISTAIGRVAASVIETHRPKQAQCWERIVLVLLTSTC